jgi:hypothetical protein
MKQTAVEWLIENSHIIPKNELNKRELIKQAKEMEKQQTEHAFNESRLTHPMIGFKHETFKDYWNETNH